MILVYKNRYDYVYSILKFIEKHTFKIGSQFGFGPIPV